MHVHKPLFTTSHSLLFVHRSLGVDLLSTNLTAVPGFVLLNWRPATMADGQLRYAVLIAGCKAEAHARAGGLGE